MNTLGQIEAIAEWSHRPSIETIFDSHLPTRLTSAKRLYAWQIRKSYDAWLIEHETAIKLCELLKSPVLTPNSETEVAFKKILGLSSMDPKTTMIQRKLIQELVEWTLVNIYPEHIAEIIKKRVIEIGENPTPQNIEDIRNNYCLKADKILKGVQTKKILPNFQSVPPEIIPFLSQEVREFMFTLSRKNLPDRKERYDADIIRYSQTKVLEESLSSI